MFCFSQLPYHPRSTVHISISNRITNCGRLFQYYSTEMTTEAMESTRRNLEEVNSRRMLFRRSHSEPMAVGNENGNMTSRTDPEWNVTVDSISIQSSFVDYQNRRKNRLKKQEAHKKSEISLSSCPSEIQMETGVQLPLVQIPSTFSLTDSDNSISSSQAKEINYEDEIRNFIEKNGHLVTNVFADPFDSDERKSRTEMWVEAQTEKMKDGNSEESDDGLARIAPEMEAKEVKPPLKHQSTDDSLLSSQVTVNSLKKSTIKLNLQEAMEAESEVETGNVDRFWDYLYEKEEENKEKEAVYVIKDPSTSSSSSTSSSQPRSSRSFGIGIEIEIGGEIEDKISEMEPDGEKDRELDEPLEITDQTVETRFFELQSTEKLEKAEGEPILLRTTASQTPISRETVKIWNMENTNVEIQNFKNSSSNGNDNIVRSISFKISENLFKDLKILLVERDRAKEALEILPAKSMKELSEECNYFQTRYRIKIEQNKERLDRRIDEIWRKLIKMPIENSEIIDFISVAHSEQLTCHARRNLPDLM